MRLSFVELVALVLAGLAAAASGVQAFVSWETRGEVSRAIVFAERIDACAEMIAALQPFAARTRPAALQPLKDKLDPNDTEKRASLPIWFHGEFGGSAGFKAKHSPLMDRVQVASAAVSVVLPADVEARLAYFEQAIEREIEKGERMTRADLIRWLERFAGEVDALKASCRSYLDSPPASAGDGLAWW